MKIDINDLAKIKGIGAKTIERIREEMLAQEGYVSEYDPVLHLGTNSLNLGDCLERMNGIPDSSVDMVLADLPYEITQNSWDSIVPLDYLWGQYLRIIKESGVVVLTASQPFSSTLTLSRQDLFKHEWIWIKNRGSNFANTVREPFKEHEQVLVFSRGRWTYNKQMQERTGGGLDLVGKHVGTGKEQRDGMGLFKEFTETEELPELRVPSSWQKFNTMVGLHPTQKPVELFEYLIKTYTNKGDLVLDNTAGVYTTAIAALNTNRRYICIEKEMRYHMMGSKWVSLVKSGMDYKEAMKEVKKIFNKD